MQSTSGCPRCGRADLVDRVTGMGHLVALGIGAFVLLRAVGLGRQVLAVLAQHVPEGMDLATVEADLSALPGVDDVHDLHIWTLTSGMNVATAHLVACQDADTHAVLDAARVVHCEIDMASPTPPCRSNPTPTRAVKKWAGDGPAMRTGSCHVLVAAREGRSPWHGH